MGSGLQRRSHRRSWGHADDGGLSRGDGRPLHSFGKLPRCAGLAAAAWGRGGTGSDRLPGYCETPFNLAFASSTLKTTLSNVIFCLPN